MPVIDLVRELGSGQLHFGGVDHDDEVAGIDVRRKSGLVLAAENVRDLGRDTPDDTGIRIDDEPTSRCKRVLTRRHVRIFLHFVEYLS